MKQFLFLLCSAIALAQNPNPSAFPAAAATDSTLFVATNGGATTLNTTVNNSITSIVLTSGTNFVAPVIIAIESEIIHCTTLTTNTLSGCTRGSEGTTAASHTSGVAVTNVITAYHHNQVAAEVKAIETQIPKLTGLLYGNNTSPNTAATGHAVAAVLTCPTSSNSGTAEACNTTPTFTPGVGDRITFQADVANTGAFTLNVNSLGAKPVKKNGTTALVANDILASPFQVDLIYDGTNWEMQGQAGNAASGGIPNQIYYFTDSIYNYAICSTSYTGGPSGAFASLPSCSSSGTWTYFANGVGQATLPPATGSFTAVGTGITFATSAGALNFSVLSTSGDSVRYEYIAAPGTPWSITADFIPYFVSGNYQLEGLAFSDGTKYISCTYNFATTYQFYTQLWTNSTTASGGALGAVSTASITPVRIKLVDNGTNLQCSFSLDGGQNYTSTYNASETAFFSAKPTRVGLFIDGNNGGSNTLLMRVVSWVQGTS